MKGEIAGTRMLPRDAVANNLTTTEAGKVLDARQGKVLHEEIQQSTASTTQNLTVYDDRVTPSAIDIPCARKTGKIVSIGGVFTVKVALASNQTSVFVLPSDCAPPFNLYFAVIRESDGKVFIGQVSSSGNFNVLHGGGLSVGNVVYFGFTYAL